MAIDAVKNALVYPSGKLFGVGWIWKHSVPKHRLLREWCENGMVLDELYPVCAFYHVSCRIYNHSRLLNKTFFFTVMENFRR